MRIAGTKRLETEGPAVEAIDVWYSERRQAWFVERLDTDGNQVGFSHRCADQDEASSCVAEWVRAHDTVDIVTPLPLTAAERQVLARGVRRAA